MTHICPVCGLCSSVLGSCTAKAHRTSGHVPAAIREATEDERAACIVAARMRAAPLDDEGDTISGAQLIRELGFPELAEGLGE